MGHPHCSGQQCLGLTALVGKNFFLASNLNLPFYFTLLLLSPHSLLFLHVLCLQVTEPQNHRGWEGFLYSSSPTPLQQFPAAAA